jgi:hypothetical protein
VRTLLILQHFEWFGTEEELKAYDESWKKFCDTVDGVELKGRYMPDTRRFHWTYLIKADSYDKFVEAGVKVPMPDRRKIPSIVNDLYYEA